jgi:SAM-dependent methyltransferase
MTPKDRVARHNRAAWDFEVEARNPATLPVGSEVIARAKRGDWELVMCGDKPVPKSWLPELKETPVLCLAAAGGQQAPILAAAGACVTVFDNSPRQLARDREVAIRDGLHLQAIEGDMRNLRRFADASFALVVMGLANQFVPDISSLWREIARVLAPQGTLIAAFMNPVAYMFDWETYEQGEFRVKYSLPYSDLTSLTYLERLKFFDRRDPLEFGHTMEAQIGGQLAAGLSLTGFFEVAPVGDPLSRFTSIYCVTCAVAANHLGTPLRRLALR